MDYITRALRRFLMDYQSGVFFFFFKAPCVFGVWVSDAWRSLYLSEEVMVASGRSLLAALRLWLDHILSLSLSPSRRRRLQLMPGCDVHSLCCVSNARSLIFIIIRAGCSCFFTSTCRSPHAARIQQQSEFSHKTPRIQPLTDTQTSPYLIKPIFHQHSSHSHPQNHWIIPLFLYSHTQFSVLWLC